MSEVKLTKNRECIRCDKFFECDGKPKEVVRCVNFVERKQKNGK
jgi:hypothetical protein